MELGLDTYSYHLAFGRHPDRKRDGPMTLAKCLNRVRKLGFSVVQVDPLHFNPEKDRSAWVNRMAGSLGIKLLASGMSVEPETLKRDIDLASEWGTTVLRTYLGSSYAGTRHGADKKTLARAVKTISESLKHAEEAGVTIAIENHCDVTPSDLVTIIETIDHPNVKICLDTGNSMIQLAEPVQTVELLLPHAAMVHVKDLKAIPTPYGGKLVGTTLGTGDIDFDRIVPLLAKATQVQHMMLEVCMEAVGTDSEMLAREDRTIEHSLEVWRQWTASLPKN